jgi:hypothetical protein
VEDVVRTQGFDVAAVLHRFAEYGIAVIVVYDQQILVAGIGRDRESPG